MKHTSILLVLIVLSLMSNAQNKIKKFNNKYISKNNYFFTYTDRSLPNGQSQLIIVQPSSAFWGTIKEDGSIIIIKKDKNEDVTFNIIATIDHDDHPAGKQLAYLGEYYFPEVLYPTLDIENKVSDKIQRKLKRIKYTDVKFVLQTMAVALKFRKQLDTIPYTTETAINVSIGAGIKYAINWYSANKSFLGQKINTLAFTPGVMIGIGAADIKAKVSAPASFKDRKEPAFTCGGFFMLGFNSINVGFAVGKDFALKDGRKSDGWFYHNKIWTGVTVGIDIIK